MLSINSIVCNCFCVASEHMEQVRPLTCNSALENCENDDDIINTNIMLPINFFIVLNFKYFFVIDFLTNCIAPYLQFQRPNRKILIDINFN